MLGDATTPPVPWGAILVVGVLTVGLVALGPETASSSRTRKMRANGPRKKKGAAAPVFLFSYEDDNEWAPERGTVQDARDWALEHGLWVWLRDAKGESHGWVDSRGVYSLDEEE